MGEMLRSEIVCTHMTGKQAHVSPSLSLALILFIDLMRTTKVLSCVLHFVLLRIWLEICLGLDIISLRLKGNFGGKLFSALLEHKCVQKIILEAMVHKQICLFPSL